MKRATLLLAVMVLAPGCITFYGDGTIEVQVLVTEEMGTQVLERRNVTVAEGATVMDALRETATVETRHGGGFVHAIDGRASRYPDAKVDWFYHVDTRLADVGATSYGLEDGQLVVWDLRPWNRTIHLPHVLTGLDAWPGNLTDDPEPTPAAWWEHKLDPATAERLFVRVDNRTLTLLDAWGRSARTFEPPWLIVHAVDGPGPDPRMLVETSGPDGAALADRLAHVEPVGLGVALTSNATWEVPQ